MSSYLKLWKPIVVAYLAVTLGRAALIYLVTLALRRTRETMPWSWSAVLTWGGLRGGLSMVLALALPKDFPFRELLLTMTFGVVILSIVIQGLSMGRLLKWLKLAGKQVERQEYERDRVVLQAKTAALNTLEEQVKNGVVPTEVANELREEYAAAAAEFEQRIKNLHLQAAELHAEERRAARRHLLIVEKDAVLSAYHQGHLSQEALDELLSDVDARLHDLESEGA